MQSCKLSCSRSVSCSKMGKLPKHSLKGWVVIPWPVDNRVKNLEDFDEGRSELPDTIDLNIKVWSCRLSCSYLFLFKKEEITAALSERVHGHSPTCWYPRWEPGRSRWRSDRTFRNNWSILAMTFAIASRFGGIFLTFTWYGGLDGSQQHPRCRPQRCRNATMAISGDGSHFRPYSAWSITSFSTIFSSGKTPFLFWKSDLFSKML